MSLNVDRAEIAKFEALASRWWDRNSEFKPLHEINQLRTNWIDERVGLAGKKVLDVGCGGGILAEAIAQRGAARPLKTKFTKRRTSKPKRFHWSVHLAHRI